MDMTNNENANKSYLVTLTATSDFATAGKQHIGRVTGPDRKWGVALDFVGARSGKRNDVTTAKITSPGLYKCRSTTRKGTQDSYVVVWEDSDRGLVVDDIEENLAVALANGSLDPAELNAAGKQLAIAWQIHRLEVNAAKPDDEMIKTSGPIGTLSVGTHTAATIRAARLTELARLRGETAGGIPVEIDRLPSDPIFRRRALESERDTIVARIAEIDAELAR